GVIVYSTCSVLSEENEDQVNNFLKTNKGFIMESLEGLLPDSLGEAESMRRGFVQLYPHRQGTDGFFIARLKYLG
ncbi:MAG: 16S rRNA (cytosine(967)-C(5))-methyltransferase RsmB, partial [Desulfocucumaceae bacterium]